MRTRINMRYDAGRTPLGLKRRPGHSNGCGRSGKGQKKKSGLPGPTAAHGCGATHTQKQWIKCRSRVTGLDYGPRPERLPFQQWAPT